MSRASLQPNAPSAQPLDYVPIPGSGWTPPAEVTDLVGNPLSPDREWFAPPPQQVGPVVAAWSTQKAGSIILPVWMKLIILLGTAIVTVLLIMVLAHFVTDSRKSRADLELILYCTCVPIALLIVAAIMKWKHTSFFVGKDGFAKLVYRGNPLRIKTESLAFADAAQLRSQETRHYHNGVYAGTHYHYNWFGINGQRVARIKGSFYARKSNEKKNTPYRYALASQALWNAHYFERAKRELEATGGVLFPVGKKDYVRVLPGALELFFKGQLTKVTPDEIAKISLSGGQFVIKHKDAGWFSGKFSFTYGAMSNAQVFLMLVERLVGYRFA
jgi:hypothetical protein